MSKEVDHEDDYEDFCEGKSARAESKYAEEKGSQNMKPEEIIERVQAFLFEDENLAKSFEDFVNKKSIIVDLSTDEYKLEYTDAFNEYKEMFERRVERFIENDLRSSIHDFYFALKTKMDSDQFSSEAIFGQILIAITDFDVFMTMMRESAKNRAHK